MLAMADVLVARMAVSSQQQQLLTHLQAGAARIPVCSKYYLCAGKIYMCVSIGALPV
jgi:hypothetical protein